MPAISRLCKVDTALGWGFPVQALLSPVCSAFMHCSVGKSEDVQILKRAGLALLPAACRTSRMHSLVSESPAMHV